MRPIRDTDPMRIKLLRLLGSPGGTWVSGTTLARELGVSRVALWKRIQALKDAGCRIQASRLGYLLESEDSLVAPDTSLPEDSDTADEGLPGFPSRVIHLGSVGSTMDTARDLAFRGAPAGTVVLADRQEAGRGRVQDWTAPGGDLMASILLRVPVPSSRLGAILVHAGTLACRIIADCTGHKVLFRWPGDIVWDNRKLGGMLLESWGSLDRSSFQVLGLGLHREPDSPERTGTWAGLRELADPPPPRRDIAGRLARELAAWAEAPSFAPRNWEALSILDGHSATWTDDAGTLHRMPCLGYDDRGNLRLKGGLCHFGDHSGSFRIIPSP